MRTALLLTLAACVETRSVVDDGVACWDGDEITVTFNGCLDGCDSTLSASCTATLDGDRLVVTSQLDIERKGQVCTEQCLIQSTTCDAPEIIDPAGITFVHGDDERALAVDACLGEG